MPALDDLKRDLADLDWKAFQQLVFELVHREDSTAERPAEPDGGADALIPAGGGAFDHVFQAKHYPGDIHWKTCQSSLDRARRVYRPKRVTFVFPRDLSAALLRRFDEKLGGRHPDVEVDRWTLSDLAVLLERHPDIASRFFRRAREDALRSAQRTIAQGGKPLDDGADLVERALAISKFTEGVDPNFSYETTTGGKSLREPNWDELPYMTLRVADDTREVRVDAWAREGSDVALPSWSFADNDDGRAALDETREALASGRSHTLAGGTVLRLADAPILVREAMGEGPHEGTGEITVSPGEPLDLHISIDTPAGAVERCVPIRPVPSRRHGSADFAGFLDALFVEVELHLLDPPTVNARFSFNARFGADARTNLQAAEVLDAIATGSRLHLRCPELLPKTGLDDDVSMNFSDDDLRQISFWKGLCEDLVRVEDHTGFSIPIPTEFGTEDLEQLASAVQFLEHAEGELSISKVDFEVDVSILSTIEGGLTRPGTTVRKTMSFTIFGREVPIGVAELTLPAMKIISIEPSLVQPGNAHVRAAAEEGPTSYRLIEKASPTSRVIIAKSLAEVGTGLEQLRSGISLRAGL